MAQNDTDIQDAEDETEAELEEHNEASDEEKETVDWKAKHDELAAELGRVRREKSRLERARLEKKVDDRVEQKLEKKKAELDETQLDYLDLKGINDPDDIEEVRKHLMRTGESLRDALRDDWLITKLAKLRREREVNDATPGAVRRSGGNEVNSVDYWLARYESTGELPKDYKLRSEVINRKVDKENGNKPAWHL